MLPEQPVVELRPPPSAQLGVGFTDLAVDPVNADRNGQAIRIDAVVIVERVDLARRQLLQCRGAQMGVEIGCEVQTARRNARLLQGQCEAELVGMQQPVAEDGALTQTPARPARP